MSRVLAGFDDGRGDEGLGAGVADAARRRAGAGRGLDGPAAGRRRDGCPAGQNAPQVGGEQSSAERPVTTAGDVSADEQRKKQTSDDAKES